MFFITGFLLKYFLLPLSYSNPNADISTFMYKYESIHFRETHLEGLSTNLSKSVCKI